MTDEELAEIEARWAAATKGPWYWQVNQNAKSVTLWGSASMVVMDFVRWGFSKATPRFRDYRDIMEKAEEFAYSIEGRGERGGGVDAKTPQNQPVSPTLRDSRCRNMQCMVQCMCH